MFSRWKRHIEMADVGNPAPLNPYDQDPTDGIPTVQLTGPWDPRMAAHLAKKDIRGLILDPGRGFECDDYGFLSDLAHLELLWISQLRPSDYAGPLPISELTHLKRLAVPFQLKQRIDFAALAQLQSCSLKWSTATHGVFDCKSLRRLYLTSLSGKKTDPLAQLATLENLELAHSGITSFGPLAELTNLKRLSLSVCRHLEGLDGIERLQQLKLLALAEVPKISSLDCFRPLKGLEALVIEDCGEIDSLTPLAELQNLKAIAFSGTKTTIRDGDLSPLTRLPKLAMAMFGQRRHYSHKLVKKWNWHNLDTPDQLLEPV